MRKLASIRKIDSLSPIDGADVIELAHVGGWQVVVKKGDYSPGDLAVYLEIDTFLPEGNPAWQFLIDKSSRVFNGVRGHVLRTIKLRGEYSQGLLLPVSGDYAEGDDVTELLGVYKYEPPIPASLAGQVKGSYPSWLPKTDLERWENLKTDTISGEWYVEEKLDGSSMTVYVDPDGVVGVTSRNLDLKLDQEGNTFVDVAKASGLLEKLADLRGIAIRGELVGPGIQKNPYKLTEHQFVVFDVFVDGKGYVDIWREPFTEQCSEVYKLLLDSPRVPMLSMLKGDKPISEAVSQCLEQLETRKSAFTAGVTAEGLVFKRIDDPNIRFKAISRAFLAKQKD